MGQPDRGHAGRRRAGVYPHLRGAAKAGLLMRQLDLGISPPAWGSRFGFYGVAPVWGYIPTCVGQPWRSLVIVYLRRVYPHLRGAAALLPMSTSISQGISPPAWGSHIASWKDPSYRGYIPTCVGQPRTSAQFQAFPRVYPHLRGAAPLGRF